MARTKPERVWLTPPELAAEIGGRPEWVIARIRDKELVAVDFSKRGSLKPRYRVHRDEWTAFLRRREVSTPAKSAPRARRQDAAIKQYV